MPRRSRTRAAPTPTLEEISPYREGLAIAEYEVVRRLEGPPSGDQPLGDRVRVVEWAVADGEPLPRGEEAAATELLTLERFEDNPQLSALYLAEGDIKGSADLPLLYRVEP